jgi:hypothetical protein
MDSGAARQSKTPDAAIAHGVTMLCCQFMSDTHTKDVLDGLQMLLDRASSDPAFAGMRDAAVKLIAARREDQAIGGSRFFAVRVEERQTVEEFAWRRFCELYETAIAVVPRAKRQA